MSRESSRNSAGLILASASLARARMLRDAGLSIQIEAAFVDEEQIKEALKSEKVNVSDAVVTLAEAKASRIGAKFPDAFVIGADQILVCGEDWYDKPATVPAAREQLQKLRNRQHRLVSGAVILRNGARHWHWIDTATLTMRDFSDPFLDQYLQNAGDDIVESVGCYRLEGLGAQLFTDVKGDFFTILGLPLLPMLEFFRSCGIIQE